MEGLKELLIAQSKDKDKSLNELGIKIGKLYTDHGFPIDMALSHLKDLSKMQKIAVLAGAQSEMIQHKRRSGATEKALDRTRESNRKALVSFIKTGESGVY
jgi:hypothetical protein